VTVCTVARLIRKANSRIATIKGRENRYMEETARWKRTTGAIAAILLGILFLVSGGWKVLSPFQSGELLEQMKVPAGYGVWGAVSLGTIELLAAFLLFTPRFRRWGGLLSSGLLVFFIVWIGYYYRSLVGQDCSCFPIVKRAISPAFFAEDGGMLVLGILATTWSSAMTSLRVPALAFVSLAMLAGISFGVNAAERQHVQVPAVTVDGKPNTLAEGKVFLFFYDPVCMHCDAASRFMSKLNWGDTKIVGIPTSDPQWAGSFLHDTGLKAFTSLDTAKLRKVFTFTDPPFGVALVNGQIKQTFTALQFTPPAPAADLKKIGFVQ
jgi:uncharacterized membrane protein YphA (DoxX/SURF4 family)